MAIRSPERVDEALKELLDTYHELNGNQVDELNMAPSPLEFMRYVAKNRPFVVRKAASAWPAVQLWSADYLVNVLGESSVKLAVTPLGSVWTGCALRHVAKTPAATQTLWLRTLQII